MVCAKIETEEILFFNLHGTDMTEGGYLLNPKTFVLEKVAGLDLAIVAKDHAPHNAKIFQDAHFSLFFLTKVKETSKPQSFGPTHILDVNSKFILFFLLPSRTCSDRPTLPTTDGGGKLPLIGPLSHRWDELHASPYFAF